MSGYLSGVRGRVMFSVLAVTAVLYSALGMLGFLAVSQLSERAIERRINEVIDQLLVSVESGSGTLRISTPDGVSATARIDSVVPPPDAGFLQVVRRVKVAGVSLVLVGIASAAASDSSLRAIHLALWIAVPLAALATAFAAWLATSRALRPVGAITEQAATVGRDPERRPHGHLQQAHRVPVPDTGDEIERLAVTLNDMLGRIEASRAEQRQFTSDAAHELRTPLMALNGELELIASGAQAADTATIERLIVLATRLGHRVDDLVLLSTLDEGRPLRRRRVDLVELVSEAAAEAAPNAAIAGTARDIEADPILVGRAVRNLLSNAVRHAASTVTVTIETSPGRAWIHVDDDGPGIHPEADARVFGRFTRLDEARTLDRGGAGLGLAIVASVVEAHGGGAEVSTGSLGGARVSMWLPDPAHGDTAAR